MVLYDTVVQYYSSFFSQAIRRFHKHHPPSRQAVPADKTVCSKRLRSPPQPPPHTHLRVANLIRQRLLFGQPLIENPTENGQFCHLIRSSVVMRTMNNSEQYNEVVSGFAICRLRVSTSSFPRKSRQESTRRIYTSGYSGYRIRLVQKYGNPSSLTLCRACWA